MKDKNLIKASEIKPGMTIAIKRKGTTYDDFCLILAKSGHTNVEYTHLDFQDSYGGAMIGSIDGKELVKVIKGKKRQYIFDHIKKDIFKYKWDIEHIIDTLRLIESMDRSLK